MTIDIEQLKPYPRICGGLPVHRFVLLVDRAPDPARLRALPGTTLLDGPGTAPPHARLRFDWPAATPALAVTAAIHAAETIGVRVLRVDVDNWVTVGHIASRIDKSRETVRLWAHGGLGPGGFPPPINPYHDTTFYSWAEVAPWLRNRMRLDLSVEEPALLAADLALQLRALLPRLSTPHAVLNLLRTPTPAARHGR